MDHELKHISFYVKKRVVSMGMCYNPALVHDKPLGSPASGEMGLLGVYCEEFGENLPCYNDTTL